MKFKLLIFLLIVLFASSVYSLEIGISPGEIKFYGNINEKLCKNISINTNYKGNIIGETKWIEKAKEKRIINDYNLSLENLDLEFDYPIKIEGRGISVNREICIVAKKPGKYYGAILYKTENSYAGVGSWIEANIEGIEEDRKEDSGLEKITGMAVNIKGNQSLNKSTLVKAFLIIFVLLFLIFVWLLLNLRKFEKKQGYSERHKIWGIIYVFHLIVKAHLWGIISVLYYNQKIT